MILVGSGAAHAAPVAAHGAGLGPQVFSALGGGIFGWDIDQNADDGLLSETVFEHNGTFLNAIEIFDERSAKVTKVVRKWTTNGPGPEPYVDAIAGNDIGFIDGQHYFVRNSRIVRDDKFYEMDPVTGGIIDQSWSPGRVVNLIPSFLTDNQASSSQVFMAYRSEPIGYDRPLLYPYDSSRNVFGQPFAFPQYQVLAGYLLYAAVDAQTDVALVGFARLPYNEDNPLYFDEFDSGTGKLLRSFKAPGGVGFVNGMAIDSTTGIMCTTSADMSVAFTDVSTGKGFAVQIPVLHGGGPLTNGAAVAADPIHHLFLVAQLNSTFSPNGGSTVIVYNERGHIVEVINGFGFDNPFSPLVARVAVNPSLRVGFVPGALANSLQSFTY